MVNDIIHSYIYIIILMYELYVQNVQFMQGVDSSPVDILRGASVEGSIWPLLKTSLGFYFVSNVNKLESVFSQKIFDPTSIVLINIKQLNKTV